jgi:hypothetical protein
MSAGELERALVAEWIDRFADLRSDVSDLGGVVLLDTVDGLLGCPGFEILERPLLAAHDLDP